jgi:hypothetical protein
MYLTYDGCEVNIRISCGFYKGVMIFSSFNLREVSLNMPILTTRQLSIKLTDNPICDRYQLQNVELLRVLAHVSSAINLRHLLVHLVKYKQIIDHLPAEV